MVKKLQLSIALLFLVSGFIFLSGCKTPSAEKPLRIALSSGSANYVNWIHRGDSTAEIVDLRGMPVDSALNLLAGCDAIVFTGGEDVVPVYYGKEYDSARCETNPGRDSLEFALIKEAMRLENAGIRCLPWTTNIKCCSRRNTHSGHSC